MILLYADDPGGVNYIAPLAEALLIRNVPHRFIVSIELAGFVADRRISCELRSNNLTADESSSEVKLLVVGTSENKDSFAHQLIDTARIKKISSWGVVDMAVNADRRFRGRSNNPLQHAPDYLAVTDDLSAKAFVALGYPVARILVCGHPHYDNVRIQRQKLTDQDLTLLRQKYYHEVPEGRPIWIFLAEGVDRLNPSVSYRSPEYTLQGRGRENFRTLIVLEEVLNIAYSMHPKPWIVLRLHPKNKIEEFESLMSEIDMLSNSGDPIPMLWAADLVLGMTTMLLIEAYLLGKPHLSILPRESEKNWLFTIVNNLTRSVHDRNSLRKILGEPIENLMPKTDRLPRKGIERLINRLIG